MLNCVVCFQIGNRAPVSAASLPNVVDCLAITGMEEEEPLLGLSPKETNTEPGDKYARHSDPFPATAHLKLRNPVFYVVWCHAPLKPQGFDEILDIN